MWLQRRAWSMLRDCYGLVVERRALTASRDTLMPVFQRSRRDCCSMSPVDGTAGAADVEGARGGHGDETLDGHAIKGVQSALVCEGVARPRHTKPAEGRRAHDT